MSGRKIQVVFDARMLRMIAGAGKTIAGTVRDALAFYDWCRRQTADGWTICALKGDVRREPVLQFDEISHE